MSTEDDWSVASLVKAAAAGHEAAWDELVDRFTPLMVSVARRYRLSAQDVADVEQTVWMRLVQSLDRLREPAALPGWIRTTVSNEALRVASARRNVGHWEFEPASDQEPPEVQVLADERHEALLGAVAQLPPRQRDLLLLLIEDPPPSYDEISAKLGIPKGSIGPTRARALERLRTFLEAFTADRTCGG